MRKQYLIFLLISILFISCSDGIVNVEQTKDVNTINKFADPPVYFAPIITNLRVKTLNQFEIPIVNVIITWKCNFYEVSNFYVERKLEGSNIWHTIYISNYSFYSPTRTYKAVDDNVGVYGNSIFVYRIRLNTFYPGEFYYSREETIQL